MTEIARYIPTDAAGTEWIVSVDNVNVTLYGVAIITDYGGINTRPYPQLYYGYFFYTTDSSVLGTTVYMYVDTGSTTRRSTTWKSITSTEGNTYYYFTFRPREIVEQLDYNNKQYAGASYTNTYSDGTIINNGKITATSQRDDYKLLGIDTLEDEYEPEPGPEPEPTNDIVIEYFESPPLYVGVNGRAREVTDMYVGVNGKARKVTAIYVGVNGRAREVFKAT